MAILEVKSVPFDNRIYNDAHSGAHLILSTWKPVCMFAYFMLLENRGKFTRYQFFFESGWYYLGPAATNGYRDAVGIVLIPEGQFQ